jgi:hypothetical protein
MRADGCTFAVRNTRKSAAWVAVHQRDRSSVVTRHCLGLVQQQAHYGRLGTTNAY